MAAGCVRVCVISTQDGPPVHPFVFRRNVEGGGRGARAKLWGMIAGAVWEPLFEGSSIAGRPAFAIYTFSEST
ncbi:uncharacterized [Tachysurus ichikawai]